MVFIDRMKRARIKKEKVDIPSVPPGFVSHTSFTLKRIGDSEAMTSSMASTDASRSQSSQIRTEHIGDITRLTKSLRHRPWINYSESNSSSDESDPEQLSQNLPPDPLPKGVLRGCTECTNCQKVEVIAKWHPEDASRPILEDAPTFYPTEEEFEDTLKYIARIRPSAEKYGICRIVPPPSWNPPCLLEEKDVWENSKFCTRIQQIDKLQNRYAMRKGSDFHRRFKRKKRRRLRMCMPCGVDNGDSARPNTVEYRNGNDWFGFEPGPPFTLEAFKKYADDFKSHYFRNDSSIVSEGKKGVLPYTCDPLVEDIEGEYWRVVEKPTEEIEVLYGADIETGAFGSGFPKVSSSVGNSSHDEKYLKSGWNLNNVSRLPGSVLSFESGDISGVLVPWLYVGMCFSSFCWHVEDHHFYSLNYMHWGAPKLWYGVPGSDASKLEMVMKERLPDLFEEQPDLLHKLVTQLSPSILINQGVPVYRCVQNPREFVLTFPRAYHSGFNCGFNCAEAVNIAPLDWLPYGQIVVDLYREQGRKTTISHDKLLLGAAREVVRAQWELQLLRQNTLDNLRWREVCGKDGILAKALKVRVDMERTRREFLCTSHLVKMDSSFDMDTERECKVCFYDLHLSAVGCPCCPEKFACLIHAKQLCACAWSEKIFLYRYDINELNILAEALEGKLSAIYRWAKLDLGLALSSRVSRDNSLHGVVDRPSNSAGVQEFKLLDAAKSTSIHSTTSCQEIKSSAVHVRSLIDKKVKESTALDTCAGLQQSTSIGEKSIDSCSPVWTDLPFKRSVIVENKSTRSLSSGDNNVIVLSDDEDDEPGRDKETKDFAMKSVDASARVTNCDEKVSSCQRDQVGFTPKTTATVMNKEKLKLINVEKKDYSSHSANLKLECHGQREKYLDNTSMLPSDTKVGTFPKLNNDSKNDKSMDNYYTPTCIPNVVPRLTFSVELLEFGAVVSGKSWSSSQFIFPKGFRSRVSYISVVDPAETCYYVSEILDAGLDGPLFMVKAEQCPSEVFIHTSITKCWDMVRVRVNEEIVRQRNLRRMDLPYVQPPGIIDGLEMFGFSSPSIMKGIEAIDKNRICIEYWKSRRGTQDSLESLQGNLELKELTLQSEVVLRGLFRKANPEELQSLYTILSDNNQTRDVGLVTQILDEEIRNRK